MVRTMSPKSYRTLPGMTVSRSMTQTALSVSLSSITLLIFVSLWTILTGSSPRSWRSSSTST